MIASVVLYFSSSARKESVAGICRLVDADGQHVFLGHRHSIHFRASGMMRQRAEGGRLLNLNEEVHAGRACS